MGLNVGVLDDVAPHFGFLLDKGRSLGGRTAGGVKVDLCKVALYFRTFEDFVHSLTELRHDCGRRLRRSRNCVPGAGFKAFDANHAANYFRKNLTKKPEQDRALDLFRSPGNHAIFDLGNAWFEMTQLPFVFAVWALKRGLEDGPRLRRLLREARQFGLDTLETIIRERTDYDYDFRKDYLSWHIHYHLGSDEKRGLAKFMELLRKHGANLVFEPRFVN